MIKTIPLREIKLGMCLAASAKTPSGKEVFPADFYFTQYKHLEELSDNGIKEVSINFSRSVIESSSPKEVAKKRDIVKKVFENPEKVYTEIKENVAETKSVFEAGEHIVQDLLEDARVGKRLDEKIVKDKAQALMTNIHKDQLAALALLDMREMSERDYIHSINVAVVSVAQAHFLKVPPEKQSALCQGAFWHDIGKYKFGQHFINKARMTELEKQAFEKHTLYGIEVLDKNNISNDIIEEIVAYHHQFYDGSGFPHTFDGAKQRRYASMVCIANYYDNLKIESPELNPHLAVSQIFDQSGTMFDPRCVNSFVKTIGIYPMGSLVELSNGMIATIIAFSPVDLLSPVVKTLFSKQNTNAPSGEIISIIESDLHIVGPYTQRNFNVLDVFGI